MVFPQPCFMLIFSDLIKMAQLSGYNAIHMATVLEDCVDQLSVLGRIMPASFEGRPDALSVC